MDVYLALNDRACIEGLGMLLICMLCVYIEVGILKLIRRHHDLLHDSMRHKGGTLKIKAWSLCVLSADCDIKKWMKVSFLNVPVIYYVQTQRCKWLFKRKKR